MWGPGPDTGSIRPLSEARSAMAAGAGELVADFEFPEPDPAPLTTITWRMGHVIVGIFGMRNASHFGGPPMDYVTFDWAGTAKEALAQLDSVYAEIGRASCRERVCQYV